jgi:hypothetical protein
MNAAMLLSLAQSVIEIGMIIANRQGKIDDVNRAFALVNTLQSDLSTLRATLLEARNADGSIDPEGWAAIDAYVAQQRARLDKALGA